MYHCAGEEEAGDGDAVTDDSGGGPAEQRRMIVMLRQWKLQRERLQADFTKALDNFQRAQRSAAQKEKDAIKKYKNQGVRQILYFPSSS